ncbi:MAG: ribokinase [Pseudopedobacter saltans]|uniref:Ribokinase n=1 Tax=Pseudopedobacter saltans TaxID=151895 RepID=A0A2W5EHD2_9SPHI|nr:MAG: ribokinase [Pseudopedobacter saltans]
MSHPNIVVVGSTNMDMVVNAARIPAPGETILAENFFMNPGGKGANQAVAVARLGGSVLFVTKVGNDVFGHQSSLLFDEEGIITKYVLSDNDHPSGVALITVDSKGENSIVVASGANSYLNREDLTDDLLSELESAKILLMQLETPLDVVFFLAEYAFRKGIKVILNPAPMTSLPDGLMKCLYLITPNETEAEILTSIKIKNIEDAKSAAICISEMGCENVVITLSSKGALIYENNSFHVVNGQVVKAIDTTAAGDVFNGALTVALSEGKSLKIAVEFACLASSISVTRIGAQSSIPYRGEVISAQLIKHK